MQSITIDARLDVTKGYSLMMSLHRSFLDMHIYHASAPGAMIYIYIYMYIYMYTHINTFRYPANTDIIVYIT